MASKHQRVGTRILREQLEALTKALFPEWSAESIKRFSHSFPDDELGEALTDLRNHGRD